MNRLLNPRLFAAVERKFGSGNVLVVNEGTEAAWRWTTDIRTGLAKQEIERSGEEYRVNCPFCQDTRKRLYINHMFGVTDRAGWPMLWLAKCFNEQCLEHDQERRQLLYHEILYGHPMAPSDLRKGIPATEIKAEWPGLIVYLDQLAHNQPDHPAVTYMRDVRKFDPVWLGKQWQFAYCLSSTKTLCVGRIIIPVFEKEQMVGWLARQVGDEQLYWPGTSRKISHYYNMEGFVRRNRAYNFDAASQYKTIVIVEGALDAIRTGVQAIGTFGKSMSPEMRDRVVAAARANGNDSTIVVMLDPKQDPVSRVIGEPHHIEVLARQLQEGWPRVLKVYLPDDPDPEKKVDPASLTPKVIRCEIEKHANDVGLNLNWSRCQRAATTISFGGLF